MAWGLPDHIWSIGEVLTYKVAPAPWSEPKRPGHPRKRPLLDATVPNDREVALVRSPERLHRLMGPYRMSFSKAYKLLRINPGQSHLNLEEVIE